MDAGKRTINDIFNGNRVLEIPFFQRAYVWGEDQWERLLEDMENISISNKPYFLGSVILKQQTTNTGSKIGDKRTLIDGQQRLTTLSIFFKVLALKTGDNYEFNRMFKLRDLIAIQHNHNDIDTYESIMNLRELKEIPGNDNITKAYNFFYKHLNPEKLDVNNILSKILFVGIDIDENEDEQQIFDTINSLGVRLTTAELLKNYFFNRNEIQSYEIYWKNIFETDEETKNYWDKEVTTGRVKRTFIDLFFYSFLQIKIQSKELKIKTEDKIEFSKVENLFESYKGFIKGYSLERESILEEIKKYAQIFKNNFNQEIIEQELTPEAGIERVNAIIFGLDTSTLIPYTLYILKNVSDTTKRNELFGYIESYIMRRMVIHANTKNYNNLFSENLIGNEVLSKEKLKEELEKKSDKLYFFPSDEDLEKGFKDTILVNKQASGIIYFIESKIRNKDKQSTGLLGLNRYSLEHLMPKKWENNWEKCNTKEEENIRNRKLLTLGNLAIITQSLNASIRDSDWQTKRLGNGNRQGLTHYSSGIETLTSFLDIEVWNEQEIEKRASFLFDKAKKTWTN